MAGLMGSAKWAGGIIKNVIKPALGTGIKTVSEGLVTGGKALKGSKFAKNAHNISFQKIKQDINQTLVGKAAHSKISGYGMKLGLGLVKFPMKHPIISSVPVFVAGGIAGTAKAFVGGDQSTSNISRQGIKGNHLGTDGLTLSLSKTRHRR